jgi:hypothetical protein
VLYAEDGGSASTVTGNSFTYESKNYNVNTIYPAYIRGTLLVPIDKFYFLDNVCSATFSGVTTGGTNVLSFLNLWADAADINVTLSNNQIFMSVPNITAVRNLVPFYTSGANDATVAANNNVFTYNNAYAPAYRTFQPNNSGTKTLSFNNNISPVNQITNATLALILGYDSRVENIAATGVFRVDLSTATAGRNVTITATNRTHNITVRPDAAWSDGTTTDRTLTASSSVRISCFEDGYWTVVSVAGSFS